MNKEIHRMQLRLEQLKKYQEQLLSEMQRVSQHSAAHGKRYREPCEWISSSTVFFNTLREASDTQEIW